MESQQELGRPLEGVWSGFIDIHGGFQAKRHNLT